MREETKRPVSIWKDTKDIVSDTEETEERIYELLQALEIEFV